MADLCVQDTTLAAAQTAFRTAANRLGPVAWALKGLNAELAGADPLVQRLRDADNVLAAELGIVGQALAELAGHAQQAGATFGAADQALSQTLSREAGAR